MRSCSAKGTAGTSKQHEEKKRQPKPIPHQVKTFQTMHRNQITNIKCYTCSQEGPPLPNKRVWRFSQQRNTYGLSNFKRNEKHVFWWFSTGRYIWPFLWVRYGRYGRYGTVGTVGTVRWVRWVRYGGYGTVGTDTHTPYPPYRTHRTYRTVPTVPTVPYPPYLPYRTYRTYWPYPPYPLYRTLRTYRTVPPHGTTVPPYRTLPQSITLEIW